MMSAACRPSMVCLHGWLGDQQEWDEVTSRLAVPSAHGWSIPVGFDWDTTIQSLVERIPPGSVLVGYSLGGRVALGCAVREPGRLAGLILVSANPGLENEYERKSRYRQDLELAARLREGSLQEFLQEWYNQGLFALEDDQQRMTWIEQRQSIDRHHQASLLECLSVASQPNYWPELNRLHIPTLVMTGALDTKYVSLALRMHRLLPDNELHVLEGLGHAVHRQRPELVSTCLAEWLDRRWPGNGE